VRDARSADPAQCKFDFIDTQLAVAAITEVRLRRGENVAAEEGFVEIPLRVLATVVDVPVNYIERFDAIDPMRHFADRDHFFRTGARHRIDDEHAKTLKK